MRHHSQNITDVTGCNIILTFRIVVVAKQDLTVIFPTVLKYAISVRLTFSVDVGRMISCLNCLRSPRQICAFGDRTSEIKCKSRFRISTPGNSPPRSMRKAITDAQDKLTLLRVLDHLLRTGEKRDRTHSADNLRSRRNYDYIRVKLSVSSCQTIRGQLMQ